MSVKRPAIIPTILSIIAILVSVVSVINDCATRRIARNSYEVAQKSYILADSALHLEYYENVTITATPQLLSSEMDESRVDKNTTVTEIIVLSNATIINASRQPVTITSVDYENRCVKWKECDTVRLAGRWMRTGERLSVLPTTLDPGKWVVTADTLRISVPYSRNWLGWYLLKQIPDSLWISSYTLDRILRNNAFKRNPELAGSECDLLRLSVKTARGGQFVHDHKWGQ